MNLKDHKIGFLGTGQMATALAAGFTADLLSAAQICGCDPSATSRERFAAAVGGECHVADAPAGVLDAADIIFLAVKPQVMTSALGQLTAGLKSRQLIVSIAAGITLSSLQSWLPDGQRVIRVMPNTPCLIQRGACGISGGETSTADDLKIVSELLSTVGLVETVPERLLDAVTGLSGSGPAYVFQMIEALSDGGVRAGLPRAVATRLAAQTLAGAADMLLQTGQHPGVLKDAVTSPGGTTIAGLQQLERLGLRSALIDAVQAATDRSRELATEAS
ncbi:MAG: pyrroline-5-carboxylate reductase [Planctomycetaceae bacterium]|nr:pyrroline-5-carboxylate reductase [Planctomycetaceae bacterium]